MGRSNLNPCLAQRHLHVGVTKNIRLQSTEHSGLFHELVNELTTTIVTFM